MKLKVKLRKIGNSFGVILPKEVITKMEDDWECPFKIGSDIYIDVITTPSESEKYWDLPDGVITEEQKKIIIENKIDKIESSNRMEMCSKHIGSRKSTCGCK
jgi:antitoxin component of MazEF toxin-antitoxin module